ALNSLPEIQGRRIDAYIILGKSIKEIAEAEGVHEESIRQSIKRGLERMKKLFDFFFELNNHAQKGEEHFHAYRIIIVLLYV
ncbi:MAG: sigma-70 region 4 domain-containing protein, partial [Clostridium perfringens]|nr:sigma-70 region 4 domain-containing protein [Clostridium perfringens]